MYDWPVETIDVHLSELSDEDVWLLADRVAGPDVCEIRGINDVLCKAAHNDGTAMHVAAGAATFDYLMKAIREAERHSEEFHQDEQRGRMNALRELVYQLNIETDPKKRLILERQVHDVKASIISAERQQEGITIGFHRWFRFRGYVSSKEFVNR